MPDPSQADLRAETRARTHADRLLSASAGIVAVSALLVSVYQTYITRQQQKLSAWPYVTQGNTGGDTSYARLVGNVGLGPALVRSMTVTVDGRPNRTWGSVLRAALGVDSARLRAELAGIRMSTSSVRPGMVLLPGTMTELVQFQGGFGEAARRALNDSRVRIRVCYCSLYDDCWVSDSGAREPLPVPACPDDPKGEFES